MGRQCPLCRPDSTRAAPRPDRTPLEKTSWTVSNPMDALNAWYDDIHAVGRSAGFPSAIKQQVGRILVPGEPKILLLCHDNVAGLVRFEGIQRWCDRVSACSIRHLASNSDGYLRTGTRSTPSSTCSEMWPLRSVNDKGMPIPMSDDHTAEPECLPVISTLLQPVDI